MKRSRRQIKREAIERIAALVDVHIRNGMGDPWEGTEEWLAHEQEALDEAFKQELKRFTARIPYRVAQDGRAKR